MDYTKVFKQSGRIFWQKKLLWLFGLLMISGTIPLLVGYHFFMRSTLSFPIRLFNATSPEDVFIPTLDSFLQPAFLIGVTVAIFFFVLIAWGLSTIGEAALIKGVADTDDGRSRSFKEMFSAGTALLPRLIAIDTVIYFPLFLIMLIGLLVVGGGMIGGILLLTRPGSVPGDLSPIILLIGVVLVFLSVLSVPVLILTAMFRLIAFRSAALEDLTTRPSIRRAWALIKGNIGQIIVVFLLLYAVSYAMSMVISILVMPFAIGGSLVFMSSFTSGQLPTQADLDVFLFMMAFVSLISVIVGSLYRVFYSAVWTLSYREWQNES